jgi:hypothetical protein
MALGALTKQLASQAIGNSVKDLLEPEKATAAQTAATDLCGAILTQIQAMQKAVKEDQELVILFRSGPETIRLLEIFVPSQNLFVFTGLDAEKNLTRVIAPVESAQLVCKLVKATGQPVPVRIITPRPPTSG